MRSNKEQRKRKVILVFVSVQIHPVSANMYKINAKSDEQGPRYHVLLYKYLNRKFSIISITLKDKNKYLIIKMAFR